MTEPIADEIHETFPGEAPSMIGDPEGAVQHVLDRVRPQSEPLTAEKATYLSRLAAESHHRAAQRAVEGDVFREGVDGHFQQTADDRNIHETAFADAPAAIESDFDVSSFGSALGVDASILSGPADDNLAAVREGISKILDAVPDDAAYNSLTANPKASLALVRAVEIIADGMASPTYGYSGQRTPEQDAAVEKLVMLTTRMGLAHAKLGSAAPSLRTRVARARLLVDESYQPGRRGHRAEIVAPVHTPRSIHHALQQNPF